jgi:hypothetical protein
MGVWPKNGTPQQTHGDVGERLRECLHDSKLSSKVEVALGDDGGRIVYGVVDGVWTENDTVYLQARSEQRLDCLSFEQADKSEDEHDFGKQQ